MYVEHLNRPPYFNQIAYRGTHLQVHKAFERWPFVSGTRAAKWLGQPSPRAGTRPEPAWSHWRVPACVVLFAGCCEQPPKLRSTSLISCMPIRALESGTPAYVTSWSLVDRLSASIPPKVLIWSAAKWSKATLCARGAGSLVDSCCWAMPTGQKRDIAANLGIYLARPVFRWWCEERRPEGLPSACPDVSGQEPPLAFILFPLSTTLESWDLECVLPDQPEKWVRLAARENLNQSCLNGVLMVKPAWVDLGHSWLRTDIS